MSLHLHLFSLLTRSGIEPHPGPVQDPCSVCGDRVHASLCRLFLYGVRPVVPPPLLRDLLPSRLSAAGPVELPHMLHTRSTSKPESSDMERMRSTLSSRGLPLHRTHLPSPDEHCCTKTRIRERQVPAVQRQPSLPRCVVSVIVRLRRR